MRNRSTIRRTHLMALAAAVITLLATTYGTAAEATVSLTVRYGDGVEKRFTAIPHAEKMTVLDLLDAAAKHARGITPVYRGRGSTVFVTQIDDLKNEGGAGRNWVFKVNDDPGDRSCGVYELAAGDAVLWYFGKPE